MTPEEQQMIAQLFDRLRQAEAQPRPYTYGETQASIVRTVSERLAPLIAGLDPLDTETMLGAQCSNDQFEKILSYIDIGRQEGAKILTGGEKIEHDGELAGGYYIQPTIFEGDNSMRIFQEEIFGPVVSVARFTDYDDAIKIANDTLYGLGAAVWSRDGNVAYRAGRDII